MNPSINDRLKAFEDYLILKNFSLATRKMYMRTLKRYLRFHNSKFKDQQISQGTAREFVIYRHKQGRSWSTVSISDAYGLPSIVTIPLSVNTLEKSSMLNGVLRKCHDLAKSSLCLV